MGVVVAFSDPGMPVSDFHPGYASREPLREFRSIIALHHDKIKLSTFSGVFQKQNTVSGTNLLCHFGVRPAGI
jgi:hypothetical protein